MMTLHLKDEMFRKLKFITSDDKLDFSRNDNSICGYVCKNMRVSNYQWSDYWNMVKKTTKKMIESQRTNATSAIKKGFRSKSELYKTKKTSILLTHKLLLLQFIAMLELTDTNEADEMPVTPVMLQLRFETDEYPVYKDFVSFFVSGVVGIHHFDRNKTTSKYSTYITVSDEAFAILSLENN